MKELKIINDLLTDKLTVVEQGAMARMLEAAIAEEKGASASC